MKLPGEMCVKSHHNGFNQVTLHIPLTLLERSLHSLVRDMMDTTTFENPKECIPDEKRIHSYARVRVGVRARFGPCRADLPIMST